MTPTVRKLCRAKRHFFCAVTKLDPKKIANFLDKRAEKCPRVRRHARYLGGAYCLGRMSTKKAALGRFVGHQQLGSPISTNPACLNTLVLTTDPSGCTFSTLSRFENA